MIGWVLALDVGATVGHALLWADADRRIEWHEGGTVRHDDPTLRKLIADTCAPTVVIETPSGYAFSPERVSGLLHASAIGGGAAWLAEWTAHRVIMTTAGEVRKALCGRANATDAMVKARISRVVENMPKRSNDHMRDAVAAGWFAIKREQLAMRRTG